MTGVQTCALPISLFCFPVTIGEVAVDYNDIDGYIWKSVEDDEFHHFNIDEIRIKPEDLPKKILGNE